MQPWYKWWQESIRCAEQNVDDTRSALFLIIPKRSGFLSRYDILQMRMAGWNRVISTFSREKPDAPVSGISTTDSPVWLKESFATAVGAIHLKVEEDGLGKYDILDQLWHRLALPLVIDCQIARMRVALVSGGYNLAFRKQLFSAAAGLGMTLVIIDETDHWLHSFSEVLGVPIEFLPVSMNTDNGLPGRIVDVIKSHTSPINGITTFTDRYIYATAEAAKTLSLPTQSAESFKATINKELMRELLPLPKRVNACHDPTLNGSRVIVKPAEGSGSFGIFLVNNDEDKAIAKQSLRALGKKPLIETYSDGPEVDVNIVLHDGRVLLTEISDNFPTTAEGFPSKYDLPSWVETGSVFPSGLSRGELKLLGDNVASHLLKFGFQTGVFHCEARVIDGTSVYTTTKSIFPRLAAVNDIRLAYSPLVAIIEINARSPGAKACEESLYSSGVDYYALQLLAACKDDERFCALAIPFSAQLGWWGSGYIPAERGGTFTTQAMFEDLAASSRELMDGVVQWTVFYKDGDYIKDPRLTGRTQWIAWFLAHSSVSRHHLENILEQVRKALRFAIV
ncbi:unnamed protein product [Penicillium salamii]|nr:unnamed protein product [Penicillium salamii]CAG8254871.1 unnamed protein product [Penicillium salamii]